MLVVNAIKLSTTSAICLRLVISNLQTRDLLGPPPKQDYFDRLKENDCVQDQPLDAIILFETIKIILLSIHTARQSKMLVRIFSTIFSTSRTRGCSWTQSFSLRRSK